MSGIIRQRFIQSPRRKDEREYHRLPRGKRHIRTRRNPPGKIRDIGDENEERRSDIEKSNRNKKTFQNGRFFLGGFYEDTNLSGWYFFFKNTTGCWFSQMTSIILKTVKPTMHSIIHISPSNFHCSLKFFNVSMTGSFMVENFIFAPLPSIGLVPIT